MRFITKLIIQRGKFTTQSFVIPETLCLVKIRRENTDGRDRVATFWILEFLGEREIRWDMKGKRQRVGQTGFLLN